MKNSNGKLVMFLRRNAVYLVLALCVLAVGLSIILMAVNGKSNSGNTNDTPAIIVPNDNEKPNGDVNKPEEEQPAPVQKPVSFILPVVNPTSITEYTESMVFNATLNRYTSHMAMDFFTEEGSNVYAVYDGVITSVETTFLQGTTITIDHGNNLYTIYNSLADGDEVYVGQQVEQGQIIGQVSLSNRQEYKSGAHLHFEVKEHGKYIDPNKYLESQEK